VDSDYTLSPGYLPPHPRNQCGDTEEVFNHHHSKLRTVIEQTFGATKAKWQMLKCVPHCKGIKQSQIILALCALHNYVHELEGKKKAVTYEEPQGLGPLTQVALMALTDPKDMDQVWDWITFGLGLLGKTTYVNPLK